jgi:tetratricopeptide (TPR) repeat protein
MPGTAQASDFGRYELDRLLGRGGMGEVYLARDRTLGRPVALKFVNTDRLSDAGSRQRLLREAQAAASLDHPSICTVFEAGEAPDGRAYIAMQYVEGETLSDRLLRGPLPVREALTLATHITDALAAAHKRGVTHRDLKPGNVIITPGGRPKLLDFGLAKFAPTELPNDAATVTGLTEIGTVIGTPPYMAPEQIQQRPVDGRADLFSLGALLVECLTGKRVFEGPTAYETIANVLRLDPPPVSSLRAELTEQHDELCARLLAKDPADRFQSAEEVHGALRVLLPDPSRTHTVPHPAPAPRRSWRWPALLGVLAATAALGGVWYWTRPPRLPAVPAQARVWYDRGIESIRESAYLKAQKSLQQAVEGFPSYALAYARLADADSQLDDQDAARVHLLRVSQLVRDETALPHLEQLRLSATRALVLRSLDEAVSTHQQIVAETPSDAGALVDLGRALEAAGRLPDARAAYENATRLDPQYAPAFLRLGQVATEEGRRKEALAAFNQAARLFGAASNDEGETEVLLTRGAMFDALSEYDAARADLTKAQAVANSPSQQIRAALAIASVTASSGQLGEAEKLATAAVARATSEGLDTLAAQGLIDLAATYMEKEKLAEARELLTRAITMASQRGARQTTAKAKLQLAACLAQEGRHRDVLAVLDDVLPFLRNNHSGSLELTALAIASRAHSGLNHSAKARELASEMLQIAEAFHDDPQIALASTELANALVSRGALPEALRYRVRAVELFRRLGDRGYLPYLLASQADLLIRLGRPSEADAPLTELQAGIDSGIETFVGLGRRLAYLRGLRAAIASRCDETLRVLPAAIRAGRTDSLSLTGPALLAYCQASLHRRSAEPSAPAEVSDPSALVERHYWLASAALVRGDTTNAIKHAQSGLTALGTIENDETRWRLRALVAGASRRGGSGVPGDPKDTAERELDNLRRAWGPAATAYEARDDIVFIKAAAGLR